MQGDPLRISKVDFDLRWKKKAAKQGEGAKRYESHVDHCGLATRATAGGNSPPQREYIFGHMWLTIILRRINLCTTILKHQRQHRSSEEIYSWVRLGSGNQFHWSVHTRKASRARAFIALSMLFHCILQETRILHVP